MSGGVRGKLKKGGNDDNKPKKRVHCLNRYTRRESNPNLKNRNLPFYPLNYGCMSEVIGRST